MAIRLVSKSENYTTTIVGVDAVGGEAWRGTFTYRRLPFDMRDELTRKHTVRGRFNQAAFSKDALEYCLRGWGDGDVVGVDGEAVPFAAEFVTALPDPVVKPLVALIFGKVTDTDGGEVRVTEDGDPLPL